MLTAVPVQFFTQNGAQAVLTATRRKYRIALRGAVVLSERWPGGDRFVIHYPMGNTGFSPPEMASAMREVARELGLSSDIVGS